MDQDPRLVAFIEKALLLLERMQQTPTSGYESMKQNVQTFSTHLTEAKKLLIQGEHIGPMRADVRDLIVEIKRGILELLRFFDNIQRSEEYKAFIVAKRHIDEFLTDPRVTAFMQKALECIEYIQHLPDTNAIQPQLHDLHDSLVNQQNTLKYHPERTYEESFATSVEVTTNGLARIAGLLPDFAASNVYGAFRPAAFQTGLFILGLPSIPQSQLEADS
jgi:hypothetical protein